MQQRARFTASVATLAGLSLGCSGQVKDLPPLGQIVLHIDTDAPLPPAPTDEASPGRPPWIFDRLRIEVWRGEQMLPELVPLAGRDFWVHEGRFVEGPVSVGLVPTQGDDTLVARVRLFRGDRLREGEPLPRAVLDSRVKLPPTDVEGIIPVFVMLHTDDVGIPRGADEPLSAVSEVPEQSAVGTWPLAQVVPCPAAARDGEACVPGGAFWMGDPALRGDSEMADADSEHLVVVSPFFIDLTEVTVGDFRATWPQLEANGEVAPPTWSGSSDGEAYDDYATYTAEPHPADPADAHATMPVNAVVWSTARAYCRARDKDLPTEAMFEFVASGRGQEHAYAWGDDEPTCDSAVIGRAGSGVYVNFIGDCRPPTMAGGPLPSGSSLLDRVPLDDGTGGESRVVVDLGGNLTEWMLDWHLQQDEGVWEPSGLLVDPVGTEPGVDDEQRAVRGGSWRGHFVETRAAAKSGRPVDVDNRSVGFRCARR